MDAAGAEQLRRRIEQQQSWREADAVRDGRQPAIDPDGPRLERIDGTVRIYASIHVRGELVHPCKRLVDGVWENGALDVRAEADAVASELHEIAHVA